MASELAERLAACRKAAGLSQTDVAAALKVSRQSVSKWERGDTTPSEELFAALASLFNVTPESLRTDPSAENEAKDAPKAAPQEKTSGDSDPALSPEEVQDGDSGPMPSPDKVQNEENDTTPSPDKVQNGENDTTPSPDKAQDEENDTTPSPDKAQDEENDTTPSPDKVQNGENDTTPSPEKTPMTNKGAPKRPSHRKIRPSSEHKTRLTAKEKKEKKEPRHTNEPPFRTVADVGPNEMAYVYVDKNNGKWRTLLPFFAALPLCAGVFALVIRHKFKK